MEIYLVRHGQTDGNLAMRHQSQQTTLTPLGRQQIAEAAAKVKEFQPTHLLSSTLIRTLESARIIGDACDLIPDTNEAFRELDRPRFLQGHFLKSLGSMWFYSLWYFGLTNHEKHGGESYRALRERVEKAKEVLAGYPHDARVVVVSHSVFINFFVAHACQKHALLPWQAAYRFIKVLTIKNGSITKMTFDPTKRKGCAWHLHK
jgi:2,3-bisphosphoglycerate-dependent phosphoglycerate mutase